MSKGKGKGLETKNIHITKPNLPSQPKIWTSLDSKDSKWRDKLPFLMVDEEAELLVNKLLKRTAKVVRRYQNPVRLKRHLSVSDQTATLFSEVYVNHTIHPQDLKSVLGFKNLPNYLNFLPQH